MDCTACLKHPEGYHLLRNAVQDLITKGFLQFNRKIMKPEIDKNEVNVITIPVKQKATRVPVTILVPAKKSPLLITMPGPVSYVSDKAVPWNYGGELYYQGKKVTTQRFEEDKYEEEKPAVLDIVSKSRITHSGRIFSPPEWPESSTDTAAKA